MEYRPPPDLVRKIERVELERRAERAERALLKTWFVRTDEWMKEPEGGGQCQLCDAEGYAWRLDQFKHTEDCIIPELESRYE